jgi:RNA polymerase sigma factor (TIGR02999 family)
MTADPIDNPQQAELAELLTEVADGRQDAADRLMPLVYEQLRRLAGKWLRQESPANTLQPTALVNEAYLRMAGQQRMDWQGKTHFFAIGATMMRRILVDHARARKSHKRGGQMCRIPLAEDLCISTDQDEDVLAIEEALQKLERLDPRQARIVELRFYGGLSVAEVAEVLKVSKRTVEADWTMIRAWLRRELSGESTA